MKALLGNHENRVPGNMKNAFRELWSVSGTMKARVGRHENRVPGNMKNAFREPWSASTVHVRVYCREARLKNSTPQSIQVHLEPLRPNLLFGREDRVG